MEKSNNIIMKTIQEILPLIYTAIFLFICFAILCAFLIAVDKKVDEIEAKKSYSVLKQMVAGKDENKALEKAVASLGVPAEQLQANHNEKQFVFNVIENVETSPAKPGKNFTVEKTPELTLSDAKKLAMKYFNTYEGNIKIADQDETHFVFSKVRD